MIYLFTASLPVSDTNIFSSCIKRAMYPYSWNICPFLPSYTPYFFVRKTTHINNNLNCILYHTYCTLYVLSTKELPVFRMCYQVTLHRMKCDGRPTIQLGNTTLVNPYGTPGPCKCTPPGPNIGPGLKCEHHICCWSLKYWVPCDDDFCSSTANVSSYVQHPHQDQPSRLAWTSTPSWTPITSIRFCAWTW